MWVSTKGQLISEWIDEHYHLQVKANSKKLHKKTDGIFSIYEKNGIIPWHFFEFSVGPFEVVVVKQILIYFF